MPTRAERRRTIGNLLRRLRLDAGLRQEDVAVRLGRPQSYVSKYESGEQSLDVIEVAEVCAALGTTLVAFARMLNTRQAKV
jgi:transcriptional regulator with XRE-family HTH domain